MQKITFDFPAAITLSIPELAVNLVLCILASFVLRYIYVTRSVSLSGKFHVGTVIPILCCVTFLVIMVVKSSLALSLGLVGALSVIRFRTPIKEPEELVYLFLAIAVGLGYGAGQTFVTTIVFLVIAGLILIWLSRSRISREDEFNLLIEWTDPSIEAQTFIDSITSSVEGLDLQKFNAGPQGSSLFAKISIRDVAALQGLAGKLREVSPDVHLSFFESRPLQ